MMMVWPLSMPAGTLMVAVRFTRVRPEPPQEVHLSVITLPLPPQVGQVRTVVIQPPLVRIWPVPWQVWQVVGEVPGLAPVPWQVWQFSLR